MELKICSCCGKELDIRHFNFRSDTNKYREKCKACRRGIKEPRAIKVERIKDLFKQGLKQCGRCNEIKEVANFNKDGITITGLTSYCKQCIKEKNSREDIKIKTYRCRLKSLYGLSEEEIDEFVGKTHCEICGKELKKKVCDHNHKTGKYRGALCWTCNVGLGHFDDDSGILIKASFYLKEHNE